MSEEKNKHLGKCRACDGTVSKTARSCPHCGQKKPYIKRMGKMGYTLSALLVMVFVFNFIGGQTIDSAQKSSGKLHSANASSSNFSSPDKQQNWILESQEGIRSKLKDPASAKFKDSFFVVWKDTPIVCGHVNSKNSMGGYGGFQRFVASGTSIAYLEEEVADFYNVWREMCQR